jgi:mevalonate kinase
MQQRLPINTATLQQRHADTYRDFFARCQRVASASNSFLWTGEFAGFYGGLTVSQKLPVRSYVGFETTFNNQVEVKRSYMAYAADQGCFMESIADERLCDNLAQYLEKELVRQPDFTGVTVHLLTELPLGHGLGSNGAISAALAVLLCKTTDLETAFEKAREILSLSQAGYSSGVSAYMALTDCQSPVVFHRHDSQYYAKPISELAELEKAPIWPVDFGLIYSGGGANAESVILANNQTVDELNFSGQRLISLLEGARDTNFKETYIDMLNLTSSLIVIALTDLFAKGTKNNLLEQLFNGLNQYQNLLHILHMGSSSTDLIYSRIHQLANKQLNDVGSGAKMSGIGSGGAVLFAVPYAIHRDAIISSIETLQKETKRPIWLDYASWLDGIGGMPAKIDQDIAADHHSTFITKDSLHLTIMRQGQLQQEVITNERMADFAKQIDLWVDATNGKILIAGEPVNSKDLPSQKATVAIVSALVKSSKQLLNNNEIPSSYGENRYDLQGKIALPLAKIVKERTGRDLQLTVRGGMYDNFSLALDPSNISIGIVEKKI